MPCKVEEKNYRIVQKGAQDSIYAVNLGSKIGIKFIVPGKCGGIAVSYPVEKLTELFAPYTNDPTVTKINLYITGGDGQNESTTYASNLLSKLKEIGTSWEGQFDIDNHANATVHYDALGVVGTELA